MRQPWQRNSRTVNPLDPSAVRFDLGLRPFILLVMMKVMKVTTLLLCGLALLLPQTLAGDVPVVREVEFERMVNPFTALRIIQAIDDAEEAGDEMVLIRLDTPGGLVVSMENVVKRMLSAKVPVVVWVGPSGAHAASAGFDARRPFTRARSADDRESTRPPAQVNRQARAGVLGSVSRIG